MAGISDKWIFRKGKISGVFSQVYSSVRKAIEQETENYILNTNETEYVNHLERVYRLEMPILEFDLVNLDSYEAGTLSDDYVTEMFNLHKNKRLIIQICQVFIPCSGNIELLNYSPTVILEGLRGEEFEINEGSLVTELIIINDDAESFKKRYDAEVEGLRTRFNHLERDIESFNATLRSRIEIDFKKRKQTFLSKNNLLASIGVPLRKKANIPSTFSIPEPQLREKISVKPAVTEKGFKPEPTLETSDYRKILKTINDVGKNFERMPSVYQNKGEEDLRDHILMVLDPIYELGSASGETFNKAGKTDIQLRYDSSVVFIAECKFWSGSKNYLSTIDQLLSYLTWRDNKASVIIFVKQKDFTSILNKVESETVRHSNYLGFLDKTDENWFNYRFHINGDRNREVKLAIQLFNIPNPGQG